LNPFAYDKDLARTAYICINAPPTQHGPTKSVGALRHATDSAKHSGSGKSPPPGPCSGDGGAGAVATPAPAITEGCSDTNCELARVDFTGSAAQLLQLPSRS